MKKIIKGDTVVVIAGKSKGNISKVIKVLEDKIIVEGVNTVKKHQKPNQARNIEGGIIIKNKPIAISNVAIFNPATKKADRVGFKILDANDSANKKNKKVRIFKSTGIQIES